MVLFLNSALRGVSGQIHAPAVLANVPSSWWGAQGHAWPPLLVGFMCLWIDAISGCRKRGQEPSGRIKDVEQLA